MVCGFTTVCTQVNTAWMLGKTANSIVISTPNKEYNVRYERMQENALRHNDHRFEWTRNEFQLWANRVANTYGYSVKFLDIGDSDIEVGSPTQMGVFTL